MALLPLPPPVLREQRLHFLLLGFVVATLFFFLLPSSSPSKPLGAHDPFPTPYLEPNCWPTNSRSYDAVSVHSVGKIPLGIKRKGLRIVVTGGAGFVLLHRGSATDRDINMSQYIIFIEFFPRSELSFDPIPAYFCSSVIESEKISGYDDGSLEEWKPSYESLHFFIERIRKESA